MTDHPSLTAPLIPLSSLAPQFKMGRNEPCWCRSGLKWKKCHENRECLPPLPISEVFDREKKSRNEPRCLHPLAGNDCGPQIIAAHSVQKRVGLKAIEENGHVLALRRSLGWIQKTNGSFFPERQGVQGASTFRGFCDKHDSDLFRPVEAHAWVVSKDTAFLLSFRAVAFEVYAKLFAENFGLWQKTWIDRGLDFIQQIERQQSLEDYLNGLRLGIKDGNSWKNKYDNIYLTGDYTRYHHLCLELSPQLPIAACGAMHIEYDFQGRNLQNLIRGVTFYDHMTFNVTAMEDRSVVILGWVGDQDGPAHEFAKSFLEQPQDRLSHSIIRLAFEHFENVFMRESWWKNLDRATQTVLTKRALSGYIDTDRQPNCLVEDGIGYFSAAASTAGIML